jgi:hypothetical protein
MRKNLIAIGAVVLLVGVAIGIRLLQLLPYPKGEFNWVESPNQRHRAYLYVLTDMKFFGGLHELYRMKIEAQPAGGERIMLYEQDIPRETVKAPIDLNKIDEVIRWTRDCTRVTYTFGGTTNEFLIPF